MRCSWLWFWFVLVLTPDAFARTTADSTAGLFQKLSGQLGLKEPRLNANEYEVRIWKKCQLCFGEAQVLYRLIKKGENARLSRFDIQFNKNKFLRAKRIHPTTLNFQELWYRLIKMDILILPDQSAIDEELHPKPQKDSTWNVVETDGSISVHAKKKKPSYWIGDGETYYFEIFRIDGYRLYKYDNPKGYLRHRPDIVELQKVISILDELSSAFY